MTDITSLRPGVVLGREVDDCVRRVWLEGVHRLLRKHRGRTMGDVIGPGPGWNYYSVPVQVENCPRTLILLNAPAALVAAAEDSTHPRSGPPQFLAVPDPDDIFEEVGLAVAPVEYLTEPVRDEYLSALTEFERREIAYHRPSTIGDVLFNWFD
jgi:hypothetical protein